MAQLSILWAGYYYTHLGYRKMGLKELPRVILSTDGLGTELGGLTVQEIKMFYRDLYRDDQSYPATHLQESLGITNIIS